MSSVERFEAAGSAWSYALYALLVGALIAGPMLTARLRVVLERGRRYRARLRADRPARQPFALPPNLADPRQHYAARAALLRDAAEND